MSDRSPHSVSHAAARLAALIVRAAALYVLIGAVAKLLWGSPADLPAVLRDNAHGRLGLLFELVIGVELFAAVAALLAPRLAWAFVSGLLIVFLVILGAQLTEGAASCGCFGSSVEIPPWVMIVVDGALVVAIIAVRPWHSLARKAWKPWALAVASVAAVASSAYLGFIAEVPPEELEASDPFARRVVPIPAAVGGPALGVPGITTTNTTRAALPEDPPRRRAWRLPEHFPRYVILAPNRWLGKRLSATNLATWTDTSKFPADCRIIFYYDTCTHCADHLRDLADAGLSDAFVMIQLPNKTTNRNPAVVDRVPDGLHVELPRGTRWMLRTPWEVTVTDGRVAAAEFLGE